MISRARWLLLQFSRRLWLRVAVFALAAVVTAVAGIFLGPYIPLSWTLGIAGKSIDGILSILAASMLSVSVFSMSTVVSAYATASASATPRATQLLMEDSTSNNVIGTFIGSFIFSLVSIIALSTGAYGDQGRTILLSVTLIVVVIIAATLLRWIDHLSRFGRLIETIDRVETATHDAMQNHLARPCLGARSLSDLSAGKLSAAHRVPMDTIGYIQHIDIAALDELAEQQSGEIAVLARPGAFVDPSRPVLAFVGFSGPEARKAAAASVSIGKNRRYDQDPRFGLCVLAEIAQRALSPAVNDPATAIDIVGRAVRLLVDWQRFPPERREKPSCSRVFVPPLHAQDLCDDIIAPIARDGADKLEVQVRLQKGLRAIAAAGDPEMAAAATASSALALRRAEIALTLDEDKQILRKLAEPAVASL